MTRVHRQHTTPTMRRLQKAKVGTKMRLKVWLPYVDWGRDDDRDWTRTVWCLTDVGRKHVPRPRGRR